MASETLEIEGHLVDSLLLAKVLDTVLAAGADYRIIDFNVGHRQEDSSTARIEVSCAEADLATLLTELQLQGANRVDVGTPTITECDKDGVLPLGFYSTTNLPTSVWLDNRWIAAENPEMDCALIVLEGNRIRTIPMHQVRVGDRIVVGHNGVRVEAPSAGPGGGRFEFMNSDVSPEKPKNLLVKAVAERIRAAKSSSGKSKVVAVCGPAVIHTGAAPAIAQLVKGGWVDLIFAGNGFATHDMESNVLGTSLGISVTEGHGVQNGHSNHLRVINEIRRYGSIAAAVEAGYVTGGVMYECVKRSVPFILGGSVRDDGPLPDTYQDVVAAADDMRSHVPDIAVALMLSSTLHAVATGNLLPADVDTFCVDINQSVVTKLTDRGSHQAAGIVSDVGLFVRSLADELG